MAQAILPATVAHRSTCRPSPGELESASRASVEGAWAAQAVQSAKSGTSLSILRRRMASYLSTVKRAVPR